MIVDVGAEHFVFFVFSLITASWDASWRKEDVVGDASKLHEQAQKECESKHVEVCLGEAGQRAGQDCKAQREGVCK